MGLDWNSKKRNLLASSSADTTVKIWDLEKCTCLQTYTQHKDKVQSVQWNPQEASVVVCGSYDKTVSIVDVRSASSEISLRWQVPADVECIQWNPLSPQHFFVSCEDGTVLLFDALKGGNSDPLWTLAAHTKATSALAINGTVPIFATGSTDKNVKIWNYKDNKPELIHSQNIQNHIFSLSFYNSSAPHLLALGGEHSTIDVLNMHNYRPTAAIFGVEFKETKKSENQKRSENDDDDEMEEGAYVEGKEQESKGGEKQKGKGASNMKPGKKKFNKKFIKKGR